MKIIFDLRNVGLGNNGGSSTLIKSGNALVDLGHDVTFIDSGKNQHTWTPLKAKHTIPRNNSEIESADFIIATGYKSVGPTIKSPDRLGCKCHWIRGWETWQMSEEKIIQNILKAPTIKLVNSLCLQRKLSKYNHESKIIRPGYDLDLIKPDPRYPRRDRKKIIIGGLYTKGKHQTIKRTSWIFDVYDSLKNKYKNLEMWMFGNDIIPGNLVRNYFQQPSISQKNYFFNNVDIWLSPAMQEGLHMPPAEAMMTACPVVGTNVDMSGTEDYLIDGYTGIVSDNNLRSFIASVEKLILNNNLRLELGVNARKKIESIGDRKYNMNRLIEYFKEII